jgi:hypothetical protein
MGFFIFEWNSRKDGLIQGRNGKDTVERPTQNEVPSRSVSMGSLYKALMRASEERETQRRVAVLSAVDTGTTPNTPHDRDEEMLKLLESVESLPIQTRKKVLQFVGSHDGVRASTLAREFAETCASGIGLSVLLVEPEQPTKRLDDHIHREQARSRPGEGRHESEIDRMIHMAKGTSLFVCPGIGRRDSRSTAKACGSNPSFVTRIRERFDLVVLPSDPINGPSEPPAINPHADAVVLVFESEVTDSQTTEDAIDFGLASVLENIAQGLLFPQQTLSCLGIPLLLLTLPAADSSRDHEAG